MVSIVIIEERLCLRQTAQRVLDLPLTDAYYSLFLLLSSIITIDTIPTYSLYSSNLFFVCRDVYIYSSSKSCNDKSTVQFCDQAEAYVTVLGACTTT